MIKDKIIDIAICVLVVVAVIMAICGGLSVVSLTLYIFGIISLPGITGG